MVSKETAMKQLVWAGLIVQLCAVPGLAQTNPPHPAAPPPTGGPGTPPISEPANVIDRDASQARFATESSARGRIESVGLRDVSHLRKGSDGVWQGTAMKNGAPVRVTVDSSGAVSVN
jgi:hypothetical protein